MHYAHPLLYDSKGQLVTWIFLSSRTFHFKGSLERTSFSFQYVLTAGYHNTKFDYFIFYKVKLREPRPLHTFIYSY